MLIHNFPRFPKRDLGHPNLFRAGSTSRPRAALERKSWRAVRASCSPSETGGVHRKSRSGNWSRESFRMVCCRLPLRTDTLFLGVLSAFFVNRPFENAWRRELAIEADSTGGRWAVAGWRAAPGCISIFRSFFSRAWALPQRKNRSEPANAGSAKWKFARNSDFPTGSG